MADEALLYAEVIGDPIAQSKSPLIHRHWLALRGIRADYRATKVRADELVDFFRVRRSDPQWLGCNVTIPHKEAALQALDQSSSEVRATGAVNCIVRQGQELVGHNSDVDGVAAALGSLELEGRTVAVLGGGGGARAAIVYLEKREVGRINLLVRDPGKAERLKQIVAPGLVSVGSFDHAHGLLSGASLIINSTPLGMSGCSNMPPQLLAAVARQQEAALFDMVYDPLLTEFLSVGGSVRVGGLSMLLGQAARAFALFFDSSPPEVDGELRALLERTNVHTGPASCFGEQAQRRSNFSNS